MNKSLSPLAPALVLFLGCLSLYAAPPPDATQIMQQVWSQSAGRSTRAHAAFETFDRAGKSTKKQFLFCRLGSGADSKTRVDFSDPAEIRGVALLSILQPGQPARQFLYTPATQRLRTVAAQDRAGRFLATDFSFEEIAEHAVDDFSYRLLGSSEQIDGRVTYKIEARPISPDRSQYQFLYLWVAQDVPVILFAQFYSPDGKLARTLHATGLHKVDGVWGARRTEVATPADGTRTVLSIAEVKFNLPLDEALFTPQALGAQEKTQKK